MPFNTAPIAEARLDTLEAVKDWISDTQRSLNRISVDGVLGHGATFRDDAYLGDGDALFHFSQPAFQSLCQKLGCRQDLLARLETPALASHVLNDLLAQRDVRDTLRNDEFVVDERTSSIAVSYTHLTLPTSDLV